MAVLNARRSARGTSWAWWISAAHLQSGRAMSTSGPLRSGSWSTLRLGECPA